MKHINYTSKDNQKQPKTTRNRHRKNTKYTKQPKTCNMTHTDKETTGICKGITQSKLQIRDCI